MLEKDSEERQGRSRKKSREEEGNIRSRGMGMGGKKGNARIKVVAVRMAVLGPPPVDFILDDGGFDLGETMRGG